MSGHSKWHSIKHKKAATDAKRGKAFLCLIECHFECPDMVNLPREVAGC